MSQFDLDGWAKLYVYRALADGELPPTIDGPERIEDCSLREALKRYGALAESSQARSTILTKDRLLKPSEIRTLLKT
jgi:hypothetical protein